MLAGGAVDSEEASLGNVGPKDAISEGIEEGSLAGPAMVLGDQFWLHLRKNSGIRDLVQEMRTWDFSVIQVTAVERSSSMGDSGSM
jgi:hypothetical protein